MTDLAEIVKHFDSHDTHFLYRGRRVAAASDDRGTPSVTTAAIAGYRRVTACMSSSSRQLGDRHHACATGEIPLVAAVVTDGVPRFVGRSRNTPAR